LFFKVGLVLVFFINSPQANKKQRREAGRNGVGVVAPWRLALWEHSACSLPVVLLISRAGSLPLAPRAPAGVSHFRNPRRRLLELPRRRRPRPKPGNSPAIRSRACRGEGGGGGSGTIALAKFLQYTHKLNKRTQPFI